MGVELDHSELAVLRPIQTTATAGTATTTTTTARPAGDADGPDAGDTGCVTPTAKSSLLPRMGLGGGLLDIDASAAAAVAACVTPTSSPCLLRPATVCPPAPRKPARPASPLDSGKRKRCCSRPGLQRAFFPVPHDLSTVFVPRGRPADRSPLPSPSPSPPRAAKKIRLNVVV